MSTSRVPIAFLDSWPMCSGFLQTICTFTVRFFIPLLQAIQTAAIGLHLNTEALYFTLLKVDPSHLPWLCPHLCPHQGICMLFLRENLPSKSEIKAQLLVLLWLIRTPQFTLLSTWFPAQLLGLLLLWAPGKDGEGLRRRMGGELWGQHCSPRVFSVKCVPCPADGHGSLRPMRVRNVPRGRRSCALVRLWPGKWGWWRGCLEVSLHFTDIKFIIVIGQFCGMIADNESNTK